MNAKSVSALLLAAVVGWPALAAGETVKIGYIDPFSGGFAIFGKHKKDGFELALDHLGRKMAGRDVEVIYGDTQRKPDVARQLVERLMKRDRVHVIAGVMFSNVLAAVQRPVVRNKTILVSNNAGWSGMAGKHCSRYFFSTSWQNDQMPEAMGELLNRDKPGDVFLLSANYQAGKDMLAGFERYYQGKIAGRILYRPGQRDFQAEISQIRAARPGAIFAFVPGPWGVAFVKQYRAAGLNETIPLYTVFSIDFLTLSGHGKSAIGTFHTTYWNQDSEDPVNRRFVEDFRRKYGYFPSQYSAQAYDSAMLIDAGVRGAKGDPSDTEAMVEAMEKGFPSTRGPFAFNVNHFPIQNFYKREVVAGADGDPTIVTRSVVFENHKDAYYKECDPRRMM